MTKIEKLQKVLEAALEVEDDTTERLTDRGQVRMAAEHFHKARGIMYAIRLIVDPTYLRKQAEILEVGRPEPSPQDIDGETAQALEIEKDLRRGPVYRPEIEARRQNGIG